MILGCLISRPGKTCDAVEERIQLANKAFWKDIMIFKSKDVPRRIKCRRLVDHVHAVFSFGSENWSSTQQTFENFKDGILKVTKLFRQRRQKKMRRRSSTR